MDVKAIPREDVQYEVELAQKTIRDVKYSHSWVVNKAMKIRRCEIGTKSSDNEEKVIILLGETGVGKTTMVTRMINHLYKVQWATTHRYKLIPDDDEKELIASGQSSCSQTQWISVYALYSGGSLQMNNDLIIIDTPGFLETGRKCARDTEIIATMGALFSQTGYTAIRDIHACVLLLRASTTRTGEAFQGVLDTIMGAWGIDIAAKMHLFTTFSDIKGAPPVINIVKEANIPFKKYYTFNNNALFVEDEGNAIVDQMNQGYWQLGDTSLTSFFQMLDNATGTSVEKTRAFLQESGDLENLLDLIPVKTAHRNNSSIKLSLCEEELAECREETKEYEDFTKEYEIQTRIKQRGKEGERGMVCNSCNKNCHLPCSLSDVDKCSAMVYTDDTCSCSVCGCCPGKHEMTSFIYDYITEKRTSIDASKKSQYDRLRAKEEEVAERVEKSRRELEKVEDYIKKCIDEVRACLSSLRDIALNPALKTVADYLRELKEQQTSQGCSEYLETLVNCELEREMENPRNLARQMVGGSELSMTSADSSKIA